MTSGTRKRMAVAAVGGACLLAAFSSGGCSTVLGIGDWTNLTDGGEQESLTRDGSESSSGGGGETGTEDSSSASTSGEGSTSPSGSSTSDGGPSACNASSCAAGCCDPSGACQTGVDTACGIGGGMCANCTMANGTCVNGSCMPVSSTTGGSDSGASSNGCDSSACPPCTSGTPTCMPTCKCCEFGICI
jgi:hypothetical protein